MARTAALPRRLVRTSQQRTLVTPEGVALPLTVASRGSRAGALMLDFIFIGTAFTLVTIGLVALAGGVASVAGRFGSGSPGAAVFQFLVVAWMIAAFLARHAYFLWFELGARGATPGKRLIGIRIAARDGGRLTAEMVIARNLLRDIELFLPIGFIATAGADSPPAWLTAAAWFALFMLLPCFNRDRLRAGDIVAGTWVVEAPRQKLEAPIATPLPTATKAPRYRFTEAELAIYGEYELQTLERILREDREAALESVRAAIAAKIGREDNNGWEDPRAFLEAYYAQLRSRLETGMRMGQRKADKFAG
ncbi:RDD family protein [Novosphingobium fluoreni]|uniref:RDD family protein n=1 Tax=Novosphingobium fluoreni TaxID=1391222 RepID=UPI003DA0D4D9